MNLQPLAQVGQRLLLDLAARLVIKAVSKKFRKQLPQIFEVLDTRLRSEMRASTSPYRVTDLIKSSVFSVTGEPATTEQVKTIISLFDPTRMGGMVQ